MVKAIISAITNTSQKTYSIAQDTDSWNSQAAESREVRVGDILLSVDGQRVQGMQLDSVNRLIAGPVGSSVNVEFQHEDGTTSRISLTRREVYRR